MRLSEEQIRTLNNREYKELFLNRPLQFLPETTGYILDNDNGWNERGVIEFRKCSQIGKEETKLRTKLGFYVEMIYRTKVKLH